MAVININIGKYDVLNINVAGTQPTSEAKETIDSKETIDALYEKLKNDLKEYNHKRHMEKGEHSWWYEVFADFGEDFDEFIYPTIKNMIYDEQFTFCLGYMWRRDGEYFS